jgi:hypothetical protein
MAENLRAEDDLNTRTRRSSTSASAFQPRLETVSAERERTNAAVAAFEAIADDPLVGADAEVRIAHLYFQAHEYPLAVTRAQHAAARTPVSEATYQADMIAGLALQQLKDQNGAGRAFGAALAIVPGGQSATLGLSTLLALSGQAAQADALVGRSFAQHASDDDPWRLFPNGDFVHWRAIVRDLHRAIR